MILAHIPFLVPQDSLNYNQKVAGAIFLVIMLVIWYSLDKLLNKKL